MPVRSAICLRTGSNTGILRTYLTGLMVLPNKSMANITRCILDSADRSNLSRFLSTAPWLQESINRRRIHYLNQQTKSIRKSKAESALLIDDTLCEHVGSLFEHVARHYDHTDNTFPIAHNPVTSHYVGGSPFSGRLTSVSPL